jgi:hypothetical protein
LAERLLVGIVVPRFVVVDNVAVDPDWVLANVCGREITGLPKERPFGHRVLLSGPPNTEFSGEPAALPSLVRCNSLFGGSRSIAS